MPELADSTCPICKESLAGRPTWGLGKDKVFHESCYRANVNPKRMARMGRSLQAMQADTLENRRRELREAIAKRDEYRREAESIKTKLVEEVRGEVLLSIRKLSLWKRLVLCFNPFAV